MVEREVGGKLFQTLSMNHTSEYVPDVGCRGGSWTGDWGGPNKQSEPPEAVMRGLGYPKRISQSIACNFQK